MKDKSKQLNEITEQTIKRYSDRFKRLGHDARALGWGSKEQQLYRFEQTLTANTSFSGKDILDVGAGFGDYFDFLVSKGQSPKTYTGWEINPDLLEEGKKRHPAPPLFNLESKNFLDVSWAQAPLTHIAVMLGPLNFNLQGKLDNYEYSKQAIKNVWGLVKELLIVDFLSTELSPNWPKEDMVFYHDPLRMLEYAFTLTPNVVLKHDYAPIPQKEFMLFLYK